VGGGDEISAGCTSNLRTTVIL